MRYLVCGTRNYVGFQMMRRVLSRLRKDDVVIEGEARGADMMARNLARELGLECLAFPANWDKFGKAAGVLRNQEMLKQGRPDCVYAFYMNEADYNNSRGTRDMVKRSISAGVRVVEFIGSSVRRKETT